VFRQRDAKAHTLFDITGSFFHATLGQTEPAHAMGQPRRAETDLGDFETIANIQQALAVGNHQTVEFQFAVTAVLFRAHDADTAYYFPTGLVSVKQKRSQTLARIIRSFCDQHKNLRACSAGDKPLAATDHPVIAFAGSSSVSQRRI